MKKGLKKRVKEVMEKYKKNNETVQNSQPISSSKNTTRPSGGFTARPDKKRG